MSNTSQTREVALGDLHLDHTYWINPRQFTGLDDQTIAGFAKELKERGVLDPPTVQKVRGASGVINLVIDGQRRVRAALEAWNKNHKITVIDRTSDPIELTWDVSDELMLEVLAMGQHREGLSSFELSDIAERMRKRGDAKSMAEIAKAIGRDESWVSKMLKARATASPKLMLAWRKGQVTDEQFKELATVKDPNAQEDVTKKVTQLRDSGDKAEARQQVKELIEASKNQEKKKEREPREEKAPNGHTTKVDGGEQAEMWSKPPPVKPQSTPRAVLEELTGMADRRAPTHDYVKGIMDGVRYALGEVSPDDFGKPWNAYMERLTGKKVTKKKAAKKPAKKKAEKKAAPKKGKKK